ncbi:abortive infection system antitoxin AbiGi family protein [Cerasicoccus fimbriatus]|uniref:abortive infection system antitoxin AbiGi family protein n=1 Tax=Cerasicoccus fimbriatus TaxID=3014554 RepID=UPI0022B37BC3|nr:abortive infection system antitoxin AbiGi family protein [Cerasicoccus sp. TK19100]
MPISSSSVFHFTNDINALKGILSEGLQVSYCKEDINGIFDETGVSIAVPMVSFCDLPLSEIKNHIDSYGKYAVGFSKTWAQINRLNPVFYLDTNSTLAASLSDLLLHFLEGKESIQNIDHLGHQAVNILRYTKNYEADLKRKGITTKNYRFSDEREWRYIPELDDSHEPFIAMDQYKTEADRKKANETLKNLKLEFGANDIKYLIIKEEEEISELIDFLRKENGKKYTYQDTERLMTRILTSDQILADF